jgi:hypothetical protein
VADPAVISGVAGTSVLGRFSTVTVTVDGCGKTGPVDIGVATAEVIVAAVVVAVSSSSSSSSSPSGTIVGIGAVVCSTRKVMVVCVMIPSACVIG